MTELMFIQMSGVPGAGKTTIAHAIARRIGAVVNEGNSLRGLRMHTTAILSAW